MLSSGCCGDGYIVQGCTKTHRPHARVLSRARHSVCGTTSEGRLNLIQYLWIEVGSFIQRDTHTTALLSLVVCVPTDSDAGPDDSRRVGNVILPHLYHPLRLCYTLCLVAGAISCCFSCLPAAIVGNNEFSRIRPSFGECAFDDYGNTGWSTNTETWQSMWEFPLNWHDSWEHVVSRWWMNVVGRIL